MLYTIRDKYQNLIAFSDNLDFVVKYIYDSYAEEISSKNCLELTRLEDEDEIRKLLIDNDEYQLVDFYDGIIITSWECSLWYDYFNEMYICGKNALYKQAEICLRKHGKEINGYNITVYLKEQLKDKYYDIVSFDAFMNSLGYDKIKDKMTDMNPSKTIYDMNKEYNLKINIDN